MRVVLDTNVLAAAFAFGGVCRAVVDVCLDAHELMISDYILSELRRTLIDKLGHSPAMAEERVSLLREAGRIVVPEHILAEACRDPGDLPILGTLVAAEAECLVTGDKDLLDLRQFGGAQIVSPRQFWSGLR